MKSDRSKKYEIFHEMLMVFLFDYVVSQTPKAPHESDNSE